MKIVSVVLGALLLLAGLGLYVLESGVGSDKSHTHIEVISHLCIIIGGALIAMARLKKRN